jgi:hypothetical protein
VVLAVALAGRRVLVLELQTKVIQAATAVPVRLTSQLVAVEVRVLLDNLHRIIQLVATEVMVLLLRLPDRQLRAVAVVAVERLAEVAQEAEERVEAETRNLLEL